MLDFQTDPSGNPADLSAALLRPIPVAALQAPENTTFPASTTACYLNGTGRALLHIRRIFE
jgi:hypothetical protein